MALQAGTRLGPYEVLAPIGAGGMGEVYRARDTRLGRDVAIKVLPADRVADEGRRRRFVQEAQAASALNHPHIITIHEIETAEGHDFIVMEYVLGKSLDALIPRQGMRLSEVLRIAIPVADALAAAHARGIIHRDLKPANVIVGTDGAVKVLDFGLAKLIGTDEASDAETATATAYAALSAPGRVAGTPAYMSPEQATGGPVDARSDIFAFGAMLYEMVTGTRAFGGTSAAETFDAVIRAQPKPPTAIVPDVPRDLEKVMLRCLRKDPQRRFEHIGDVKIALQDIKEESESGSTIVASSSHKRRVVLLAIFGGVAIVGGMIAMFWLRSPRSISAPPLKVVPLTALHGLERWPTWGRCDVYILDVDPTFSPVGSPRRLTTQLVNWITSVAWSRDGQDVIYNQTTGGVTSYLWRIRADGSSQPQRIEAAGLGASYPATAASQDRLVFSRERIDEDIYSIANGKASQPLLTSSFVDHEPQFSPDGRRIAFSSARSGEIPEIWLAASDGTGAHQLTHGPGRNQGEPHWSPDGQSIVFETLLDDGHWHLYVIDADGGPVRRLTRQTGDQNAPSWSHDGQWIYFSTEDTGGRDIWRMPAKGGPSQPVTKGGSGYMGRESADGESILYKPDDSDAPLLAIPVTGGRPRQIVSCVRKGEAFTVGAQGIYYVACAPGPNVSVHVFNVITRRDTVVATLENMGSQSPSRGLLRGERDFSVSADGRTILYTRIVEATSDLMLIDNFR